MPLLCASSFQPFPGTANGHLQTLLPALLRPRQLRGALPEYEREQLLLGDGDYLDLDWIRAANRRAVILCHGLEGSSRSPYMRGFALAAHLHGYDALAWNYRGCGGAPNHLARSYHSGATEDLRAVVDHVAATGYEQIALVGFSLGGNLLLKYLGEAPESVPPCVFGAVAVSPPCDLRACAYLLNRWDRRPYLETFLRSLRIKTIEKAVRFPSQLCARDINSVRDFITFDNRYTAPLHGFADAEHYWAVASSLRYLDAIKLPTLLLTAADDPLLAPSCIPHDAAARSQSLHLEVPPSGGHIGFLERRRGRPSRYYAETRSIEFLTACRAGKL